eukprot:10733304-Ditylum_brightwellii.AAC.2
MFKLPCSCDACIQNPHNISGCKLIGVRGWEKKVLKEQKGTKNDKYKVSELKEELREWHLGTTGLKKDMIMALVCNNIKNESPSCNEDDNMLILTSVG